MNKELTPLEALEKIDNYFNFKTSGFTKEKAVIEKALEEKELQDTALKTMKEIIQFKRTLPEVKFNDKGTIQDIVEGISLQLQRDMENKERELFREWVLKTCFPKELKALAVLSGIENIDLAWLKVCFDDPNASVLSYNRYADEMLTQEEYDLLKEALS